MRSCLDDDGVRAVRAKGLGGGMLCMLAACLVTCAYVGGLLLFGTRFLPGTSVLGEDVSLSRRCDVGDAVGRHMSGWALSVTGDGVDASLSAADAGVSVDASGISSMELCPTWPVDAFVAHEFGLGDLDVSVDEVVLRKSLEAVVARANDGARPPEDARVELSDDGAFVVVDDVPGTELDVDAVVRRVLGAASRLETSVELGEAELVPPGVTSDDEGLRGACDKANRVLGTEVALLCGDEPMGSVGRDLVRSWVRVDGTEVVVDADAVRSWARGEFSDAYDTVGRARHYVRPDGTEVDVPGGDGTYGWVVDGQALCDVLVGRLGACDGSPVDVPMRSRGAVFSQGGQDWPSRYVDVDLSAQHAWLFDGNDVVWESDCVSGDTTNGHGTVVGVFSVEQKASPMVLVGLDENGDGRPDYETPVTFWMPFCGGYGLHDATWRGVFGGSVYAGDGSHGCVNLPYGAASELYGLVEVGDVVVVHW